jgi:hypothetical protein
MYNSKLINRKLIDRYFFLHNLYLALLRYMYNTSPVLEHLHTLVYSTVVPGEPLRWQANDFSTRLRSTTAATLWELGEGKKPPRTLLLVVALCGNRNPELVLRSG